MSKTDSFIFLFIIVAVLFMVYKKRYRQVISDEDRCMAVICGGFDPTGKTGCPEGCKCPADENPANLPGSPPPGSHRNCVPA